MILKSCPFCEGDVAINEFAVHLGGKINRYQIYCTKCHTKGNEYEKLTDAVDSWNKRSIMLNIQNIITINGYHEVIKENKISYEDILALLDFPIDDIVTVTYRRGPVSKSNGILVKGESVQVEGGMIINATYTDRS